MSRGPLLVLLLAATPPTLGAQGAPADTTRLPEVTSTATRLPLVPAAVTTSQTVIDGDELRARGIRYLIDALRDVPGLQLVQSGSFGGVTSLFTRGGNSNFTKVLVDGVPVNQPGGAFDFSTLTVDNIERIEVVRGPASVVWGADAVTGVVQVFTRTGRGRPRAEVALQGGTFGTVQWDAGANGGDARFGWSAQVSRITSDGIFAFNNQFRNTVASGALSGRLDDATDARLTVRYNDARAAFPTNFAGVPRDSNQFTSSQGLVVGLDGGRRLGARAELRATLAANLTDAGFTNNPDFPGDTLGFGFRARNLATTSRRSADVRTILRPADGVQVTAGTAWEFESTRQNNQSTSLSGGRQATSASAFDAARNTLGAYAQGVAEPVAGLALNGGVRLDENSAFGTFFTWRAGAAYRLASGTRLRASAGRAFRAPGFNEQFAATAFERGDSLIRPERSTSWEVAAEQVLLGGRLSAEVTYFDQRFRDLIQFTSRPAPAPTYLNIAGASSRGVEAVVAARPVDGLALSANLTWLDTEVTDQGPSGGAGTALENGQRLLRRPAWTGRVGASYRLLGRATLGANLLVVGAREDLDFSGFPARRAVLPRYELLDLTADVDLVRPHPARPGVALTLRVENVTGAAYQTLVGFPGRGRAVLAGGRVAW